MSKFNWVMRACGIFLLWATAAVALPAQTLTTLHRFDYSDGDDPYGGLVQATDGNFYGTTYTGGANYQGTVFKITPSGQLTTLHNFDYRDGEAPTAALVQGTDGNFYGTTPFAGPSNNGTAFRISPSGRLTRLFSFCDLCPYGSKPWGGLIQATDGRFYGTTQNGGYNGGASSGTVFRITSNGALKTLHKFNPRKPTDGADPVAGLVQGTDGNFYGTTAGGGLYDEGTVFKITPSGKLTTLHSFCHKSPSCPDGGGPGAALVQATDGNFYGTAGGGANHCGLIFKITPSGKLTTVHHFDATDGFDPGRLTLGNDGNIYGTTTYGGAVGTSCYYSAGGGTVFKITPNGVLTTLYEFCVQSICTDGASPASLVQGTDGDFYGTTTEGGAGGCGTTYGYGCGTIFRLSVGLGPFVKPQPTSGEVDAAVTILGTNLTGSTSVTFNGTAATFTVVSASEITTTVPTGATTGTIQVVTPGGTLSSNVPFQVK
jgi:uncharacterized repeat protein (TIGR03803 family)